MIKKPINLEFFEFDLIKKSVFFLLFFLFVTSVSEEISIKLFIVSFSFDIE